MIGISPYVLAELLKSWDLPSQRIAPSPEILRIESSNKSSYRPSRTRKPPGSIEVAQTLVEWSGAK